MSNYNAYLRKLVAGNTRISKLKLKPGQIISFQYIDRRRRRVPRVVFVLNTSDGRSGSRLVHGLNLENLGWAKFKNFIKAILVSDTVTLIKRKYEIRGPFSEIVDKPLIFYKRFIKPTLVGHDMYRTYKMSDMKTTKIHAIDYSTLFNQSNPIRKLLITKENNIRSIMAQRGVLKELFNIDTLRLKDRKYNQMVIERFGTEEVFAKSVIEINEMVNEGEL